MFWDIVGIITAAKEMGYMTMGKFYMEAKEMGWIMLGIVFIIALGSLLKKVKPRPVFMVILNAFWISIFTITRKVLAGTIALEIGIPVLLVLVGFFIVLLAKCIMKAPKAKFKDSSGEEHGVPAFAIVTRWGGPIWVAIPGRLYWRWWPFDVIGRLIPTILYKMDIAEFEVHTKEEKEGESAKPVKVVVSAHVNFPKPEEEYDLDEKETTKILEGEIPTSWEKILDKELFKKKKHVLKGEKLLMDLTFFNLPQEIMLDEIKMTNRFKAATMDGLITQMPQSTYKFCREHKKELEIAVKKYWLTDPANVFVRVGIPPRLLDVSITFMRATDDRVENALYIEEIEATQGRAEERRRTLGIGEAHKGIKASLARNLPSAEKDRMAHSYLSQQMSLDKNALTDIRVEGAEGIEKSFLNGIALLGKMLGGGFQKPPLGKKEEEKSQNEKAWETYEKIKEREMKGK